MLTLHWELQQMLCVNDQKAGPGEQVGLVHIPQPSSLEKQLKSNVLW